MRKAFGALAVGLLAGIAWADRGVYAHVPRVSGAVVKPVRTQDQRALLAFDEASRTETLVIETTVEGEGTELAWVLPLPAAPRIEASTTRLLPTPETLCTAEVWTDTTPWWLYIAGAGAALALFILLPPAVASDPRRGALCLAGRSQRRGRPSVVGAPRRG